MADNATLHKAKREKKDEFYTQLVDIENEVKHYKPHFEGKVVYLNCDDPWESNFFKYFAMNFNHLKLKKLIATSYAGSLMAGTQLGFEDIGVENGRKAHKIVITEVTERDGKPGVNLGDVEWLLKNDANTVVNLEGDGDFRSDECVALLEEADIVVTNPPFSLFREYVAQLIEHDKEFLILGNQNAITYKEIFPLLKDEQMWLGVDNGGCKWFHVPEDYEIKTPTRQKWVDGKQYFSMGNVNWFTNLDNSAAKPPLTLFREYTPENYPRYDNYDAINVDRVADIPVDYDGAMGVPITYMARHAPATHTHTHTHTHTLAAAAEDRRSRRSQRNWSLQRTLDRQDQTGNSRRQAEVRENLHPVFRVIEFVNGGSKSICIDKKHKYGRIMIQRAEQHSRYWD